MEQLLYYVILPFTDKNHYFHVAAELGKKSGIFTNQFENLNDCAF